MREGGGSRSCWSCGPFSCSDAGAGVLSLDAHGSAGGEERVDDARAYFQGAHRGDAGLRAPVDRPADNVMRMEIAGEEGDASYAVRVESENGKVDINFVSEEVLLEMLRKGGLPEDRAESVRDAILDCGTTTTIRARGERRPRLRSAAGAAVPRNGKLLSIEELRFVRGVTRSCSTGSSPGCSP